MTESERNRVAAGWPLLAERIGALVGRITPAGWQRLDAALAVALLTGLTLPVAFGYPSHDDPAAAVVAFGAGATLPLAVRRRWPIAVLVTVVVCVVAATALGIRVTPFGSNASPVVGLAMYTVAARFSRRISVQALALVVVATFAAAWIATSVHTEDRNAVDTVAASFGWLLGDAVRTRRGYQVELVNRRREGTDERARRNVVEERLQISREVHDVVSHNLSVIAVRSGVGRMVFDTQPEEARAALVDVEAVSRNALAELRLLLGTVRDPAPLVPARRLEDLPDLVEQMAVSGVDVTLELGAIPTTLSPTMELSAYRIVQEALTNVVKHTGPTRAQVVVSCSDDVLSVEVCDDGPADQADQADKPADQADKADEPADQADQFSEQVSGARPSAGGDGWGIVGMRERAAVFGGTIMAGPRADGGFRVLAQLPLGPGQANGDHQ